MNRRNFIKSLFAGLITTTIIPTSACTVFDPEDRFNLYKNDLYNDILTILQRYYYEHNTKELRQTIVKELNTYIHKFFNNNDIQLYELQIICDETNNTVDSIDNNEINVSIAFRISNTLNSTHVINFNVKSK